MRFNFSTPHYFFILAVYMLSCCFVISLYSAPDRSMPVSTIVKYSSFNQMYDTFEEFISQSFLAHHISFQADIPLSQKQWEYLTGLSGVMNVDRALLAKACFYLYATGRFSVIQMQRWIDTYSQEHLHIILTGQPVIVKVRVWGVLTGKDVIRSWYPLEPGNFFDVVVHQQALQDIEQQFKNDGYFQACVQDTVSTDPVTQTVTVDLHCSRGKKYTVESIALYYNSHQALVPHHITDEIEIQLNELNHKNYSRVELNKTTLRVSQILSKYGFFDATIKMVERIDKNTQSVAIDLYVEQGEQKPLYFCGNSYLSTEYLFNILSRFGKGILYIQPNLFVSELKSIYYEHGFWSAQIHMRQEEGALFFLIEEGAQAYIEQVQVIDTTLPIDDKVILIFQTLNGTTYDHATYTKVSQEALSYLITQGYLDACIVRVDKVLIDKNIYDLKIIIDQKERAIVDKTIIVGHPDWQEKAQFDSDVFFTTQLLKQQQLWITEYAQRVGYVIDSINPHIIRTDNRVVIEWNIIERTKCFGKMVVVGSPLTKSEYITDSLSCKPGIPFDRTLITHSIHYLSEKNLFERIHVNPALAIDQEVPLILNVYPKDTFNVLVRTGVGLQKGALSSFGYQGFTYKLGGSLIVRDPLSRSDVLGIDVDLMRYYRELYLYYSLPIPGKYPVYATGEIYNHLYQYPGVCKKQKTLYEVSLEGVAGTLERQWIHTNAQIITGVECTKTRLSSEDIKNTPFANRIARAINFEPTLLNIRVPYIRFEPSLFAEYLDSRVIPTKGYSAALSAKGLIPLIYKNLASTFVKLVGEYSLFVPFYRAVFAARVRAGYIFYDDFKSIMPSERFYLGGPNSIRSYEVDMCPPLGIIDDHDNGGYLVPQGAKAMININLECRVPVWRGLSIVFFQDLGALGESGWSDALKAGILSGTGFGFRYDTPLGPLRFDLGVKASRPDLRLSRYAWYITFGNAF